MKHRRIALSADIGGTFTDIVVEAGGVRTCLKVLTTHAAPEAGLMGGIDAALAEAGVEATEVDLFVHGTTLATNAILERKGARTALVTTEGFRDSLEIGYENRFEQYDIFMQKPQPLVPRDLRFSISERVAVDGEVLRPLDADELGRVCEAMLRHGVESVAIGFLHSYANSDHERIARGIVLERMPEANVTISSEVCPEAREYERFSTACANAYVQPAMSRYLERLKTRLAGKGFACPLLLMSSGGGLVTVETAIAYPIRLVESGPAGGAMLSAHIAKLAGETEILSFDMGGTTAKMCLIDHGAPLLSRDFEVDRQYRFLAGSGLPLRIPVIDMVEIGAGGGSIASVDALGRVTVGPRSAGSEPGPACYDRGGEGATVTDANLLLGRIDPHRFAGGSFDLAPDRAAAAIRAGVAGPMSISTAAASHGICEIVEENMANAARVHAIDRGVDVAGRTLIAFGGGAPLHAAGLAEKLGIRRVLIPKHAGVGSAVGFLRAPISYQVVRSSVMRLDRFEPAWLKAIFAEMSQEASGIVRQGAPGQPVAERRALDMRYRGQGHEISVPLSDGEAFDASTIARLFDESYSRQYGRVIPGMEMEITGYSLVATALADSAPAEAAPGPAAPATSATPAGRRRIFDAGHGDYLEVPVYQRADLVPGAAFDGPAVIVEDETTTVVTGAFHVTVDRLESIVLSRNG